MTLALIVTGLAIAGLSFTVSTLAFLCMDYHADMLRWKGAAENTAAQWETLYEVTLEWKTLYEVTVETLEALNVNITDTD